MHHARLVLVFALLLSCLNGCQGDAKAEKEKFIKDMVAAFGNEKKDLLKQAKGVYEDIRVYRDGKKDVVVFERKLSEGHTLEDPDLKTYLVQEVKKSESSLKALKLGVQVRMIDKNSEEKVISDVTISSKDL